MNHDISSRDYSNVVVAAVKEPWTYIGAGSAHLSNIAGKAGQALADASNLANQIRSGLLSDAQKYQAASNLWGNLRNGLSYELVGMRGKLSASEQKWADKAVDAMQSVYVMDDLISTKGGAKFANTFLEFSRNLGGIVSAFQLIS